MVILRWGGFRVFLCQQESPAEATVSAEENAMQKELKE